MATMTEMQKALQPFGWECGPEFWQRYHSDPWVFNLANAVVRLTEQNTTLLAELKEAQRWAEA